MRKFVLFGAALVAASLFAATVVDVTGTGIQKTSVQIAVANPAFKAALKRNLEMTGLFIVEEKGAIVVSGVSGALQATGAGKTVSSISAFTDDKSARTAARRLSDLMCDAYGKGQKGFAQDRMLFLKRGVPAKAGDPIPAELCTCYPDGQDIRQLTNDGKMVIFQRWAKEPDTILYISDRNGATQIWQMNIATGERKVKWSFKGTPTGIAVSPDGTKVAAILSIHGNPELYVIDNVKGIWTRLTQTPYDVEGQPTWSPDGTQIAFVRGINSQHIWTIDLATKREKRLTSKGRKNVDPDWGKDGRIAYVSGNSISVMDAAVGDSTARSVTKLVAKWEHPSWSRDGRHLTASRDKALFVIDTLEDGDSPRQVFSANGNWTAPCWVK